MAEKPELTGVKAYKSLRTLRRAHNKKNPAVPVTLPTGAVWMLRRVPLDVWTAQGRLPQVMVRAGLEEWKKTEDYKLIVEKKDEDEIAKRLQNEMTAEDLMKSVKLTMDVLRESVAYPRIVENADPESDDEIAPEDVHDDDVEFILEYGLGGSPDVPVETEEGATSLEGLKNFPVEQGGATDSAGVADQDVLDISQPDIRAA